MRNAVKYSAQEQTSLQELGRGRRFLVEKIDNDAINTMSKTEIIMRDDKKQENKNIEETIYMAICKMQSALTAVEKKRTGYNFKYSDLSDIWDVIRGPLTDNGLSLIQLVNTEESQTYIITRLYHVSGECIESRTLMEFTSRKFQEVGSAITYYRRYALSAMLGVVSDEDVDSKSQSKQQEIYQKKEPPKLTPEQVNQINVLLNGYDDIREQIANILPGNDISTISQSQFGGLLKWINKAIADKSNAC